MKEFTPRMLDCFLLTNFMNFCADDDGVIDSLPIKYVQLPEDVDTEEKYPFLLYQLYLQT